MTMYVYSTGGEAVGFLFESFVFDLHGTPLGRLFGSRIHRLDGSYAGEWFHQMVVERRESPARSILGVAPPAGRAPVSPPEPRRSVAEYRAYPDAFHRLYPLGENGDEGYAEAAE
jgi:4-fold beta flower protein